MIQITAHMKILVAVEPVDFGRGIEGLAAVCRQALNADPMAGTLFATVVISISWSDCRGNSMGIRATGPSSLTRIE